MFVKINTLSYIFFFLSIFNQAMVNSGTVKFINKNINDTIMKHDKNWKAFDIGDYNFTEYFRNLDSRKTDLKIVTHTANNEVTNLQNLDSVSKKNVLRRKGNTRFLDLFSIIKFENKPCSLEYDLLETTDGTCYHKTECDRLGGLAVGSCAKGFGVCCICK